MKLEIGHIPTRLSEDLQRILDHAAGNGMTLQEIVEILHGRGFDLLVILLALPFVTPIPFVGLSTPFGMVLMLFGLRIALRKRPWLPPRLLQRKIPYETLSKIIKVALAVACRMEKIIHPRLRFFNRWISFSILNGLVIMLCAFALMLPLPIPLTNTLPAISIILVAVGMMEEDGLLIVGGYFMTSITSAYFISLWLVGKMSAQFLGLW